MLFLGGEWVSFVFFCFGNNQQTLLFFTCLQLLVLSSPEFMTSSSSSILDCLNNREDTGTSMMALSSHDVVGTRTSPKNHTSLLFHLGPPLPSLTSCQCPPLFSLKGRDNAPESYPPHNILHLYHPSPQPKDGMETTSGRTGNQRVAL